MSGIERFDGRFERKVELLYGNSVFELLKGE
jgi:hypothetical protein